MKQETELHLGATQAIEKLPSVGLADRLRRLDLENDSLVDREVSSEVSRTLAVVPDVDGPFANKGNPAF